MLVLSWPSVDSHQNLLKSLIVFESLGLQSYLLRRCTGWVERVQSYLLRRYNWSPNWNVFDIRISQPAPSQPRGHLARISDEWYVQRPFVSQYRSKK